MIFAFGHAARAKGALSARKPVVSSTAEKGKRADINWSLVLEMGYCRDGPAWHPRGKVPVRATLYHWAGCGATGMLGKLRKAGSLTEQQASERSFSWNYLSGIL